MKIIECLQGTTEWLEARRAMITGTKLDSVMGTSLDKIMLISELIAEEATETVKSLKPTAEMERGSSEEVFARKHYEALHGKKVTELGFCISDEFPYLGCSGDGWIENKKGLFTEAVEIKSPDSKNAVFYKLETMFSPEELGLGSWSKPTKTEPDPVFKPSTKVPYHGIPSQYKWQCVNYFLVNTDLQKLNFLIYDARFISDNSKLHVVEITREQVQPEIDKAKIELVKFREFWLRCREAIIVDNF